MGLTGCDSGRRGPDPVRSSDAQVSSAPAEPGSLRADPADARPVVVFLGTSLTAGYGLEDPSLAFPALVQARIDAAGLDYRVVNGGVSGDTSAGGLRRVDWLLEQPVAVLVLELGANDGLRGQDPEALKENLLEVIRRTRAAHPEARVLVAGMEAPPNLGDRYTARFRGVFREVADETGATLLPFLLEGVAGEPALNQEDGIHPTPEGHRVVADHVWAALEPLLR
ncbi:MAG: arylesterase [Gemmatimonadetes bacterium]|nr:arylesterase [Gemmatimonadota bacterium]